MIDETENVDNSDPYHRIHAEFLNCKNMLDAHCLDLMGKFKINNTSIVNDNQETPVMNSTPIPTEKRENKQYQWEGYSNGFARKNINKMGFTGKGLGIAEDGIREPIEIKAKRSFNMKDKSTKKSNKPTICVLSDSMLNQINGEKLSRKKDVKVFSCGGCTVKCMYTHLPDVFALQPEHIILHIGTNDCILKTSDQVLNELNSLKSYIEKVLPSCNVIISMPTIRADNPRANTIIKNLNFKLKRYGYSLMDNSNIKLHHIAGKGLHLSKQEVKIISSNLISLIKRL